MFKKKSCNVLLNKEENRHVVATVILAPRKWGAGSGAEGHPSEFENLPQNEENIKANNFSALRYVSVCNFSGLNAPQETRRQGNLAANTHILAPGRLRLGVVKFEASLGYISKSPPPPSQLHSKTLSQNR